VIITGRQCSPVAGRYRVWGRSEGDGTADTLAGGDGPGVGEPLGAGDGDTVGSTGVSGVVLSPGFVGDVEVVVGVAEVVVVGGCRCTSLRGAQV
jgi:hypothetical protein